MYHVVIVDDSGNEVVNDNFTGISLLADAGDGKLREAVFHDSILNLAAKLSSSDVFRKAMKVSELTDVLQRHDREMAEESLLDQIMRGMDK